MAIPFNENLRLTSYENNPNWHQHVPAQTEEDQNQLTRVAGSLVSYGLKEPLVRSVQFIRDIARLSLKVPVRIIKTPICFERNWKTREQAKVNAKLTGYSFVQLITVPVKFTAALTALALLPFCTGETKDLLDVVEELSTTLDGKAAQLEALKEEGIKKALNRQECEEYRDWLYSIPPKLCVKP